MKTITIKVNSVPGHASGTMIPVECDRHGTPLSPFWRRRLLDAETDQCCEVFKESKAKKVTKESKQDDKETKGATP